MDASTSIELALQEAERVAEERGINLTVVIGQKRGGNRYFFTIKVFSPLEDELPATAVVALNKATVIMLSSWGDPAEGCWVILQGGSEEEENAIREVLNENLRLDLLEPIKQGDCG